MATLNWIGGSGSLSWATAANWDTTTVPVAGDTVNILQGNSDIQSGLNQSAVVLASLTVGGSFSGTIADASGNPLQIDCSGTVYVNSSATRFVLKIGTTCQKVIVSGTGNPGGSYDPFVLLGGSAGLKVYVANGAQAGIATGAAGLTATLNEWNADSATLTVAPGVTWTNGYQGGNSTAKINSGGTLIQQSGNSTLITGGSGAIGTISVTKQATLNNRPAAGTDAIGTLSIGPNATADFSTDPRPLTLTNAVLMATGSTLNAFDPQQVQLHAGSLQVRTSMCGLSDVTVNIGAPVLATLATG